MFPQASRVAHGDFSSPATLTPFRGKSSGKSHSLTYLYVLQLPPVVLGAQPQSHGLCSLRATVSRASAASHFSPRPQNPATSYSPPSPAPSVDPPRFHTLHRPQTSACSQKSTRTRSHIAPHAAQTCYATRKPPSHGVRIVWCANKGPQPGTICFHFRIICFLFIRVFSVFFWLCLVSACT